MFDRVESITELRNPRTTKIDEVPVTELLQMINEEDATVPKAVADQRPQLAEAVVLGERALRDGGTIHYFGAGTSGRLAVLDAAELPPTYSISPDRVVAHLAGGPTAVKSSLEDVEDDLDAGRREAAGLGPGDLAVGLTASGRTPYVAGALERATQNGTPTVLITSNPGAPIKADVRILLDTGPEVISGSTRMKAGTAAKLALNAFSTAVMVRLGLTYSNLMINAGPVNSKLRGRQVTLLVEATGLEPATCADTLERADGDTRVALVSLLAGVPVDRAVQALAEAGGVVRLALPLAKSL